MIKKIILVLLIVFSSFIWAAGGSIPNFQMDSIMKTQVNIHDYTQGNDVTFLIFFTTWCPYCEKDILGFQQLFEKYKNKGVGVVAISFDKKKTKVVKYVNDKGLSYPVVMGNDEIAQYFSVRGIPVTVALDENNNVIEKIVGYKGSIYYENIIKQIIKASRRSN